MRKYYFFSKGFTLLELLIATVVGGVVCILLFSFIDRSLFAWGRTLGLMDTHREARAALHQIASDVRGGIFQKEGSLHHIISTHSPRRDQLQVLTIAKGQWKGDIGFVRYELVQRNGKEGRGFGFDLVRVFYSPIETLPLLTGKIDFLKNSKNAETLAQNVFSFSVDFLSVDEDGKFQKVSPEGDLRNVDLVKLCLETVPSREALKCKTLEDWENLEGSYKTQFFYLMIDLSSRSIDG